MKLYFKYNIESNQCQRWTNPNHDWITHNDLIWRTRIWFGKRVIWFEILWFDLKSFQITILLHNTILLRVIDQRRRPCFVSSPLSFSNSTVILIYLELTVMNVCKTIVIFARFDSYYVNWTFSKNSHCGETDLWFDLDLKWFGFDLIICDLISDLRFWFKSFLPMICDLDLWFDLWFAHHWSTYIQCIITLSGLQLSST